MPSRRLHLPVPIWQIKGRFGRLDGYTLVISHVSPLGIAPGIYPKLPYDVVKDIRHISLIGHTPSVLIVPADSPYKTLADYIAAAKAKPDEIAFGRSGIGSNTHSDG